MNKHDSDRFHHRFLKHFSEETAPKEVIYIGLFLIVAFLTLASLSPKLTEKFGKLSQTKESQETYAAALAPPCGQYGDVDGNGSVNATDTLLVTRYVAGQKTTIPFTDTVKKRADVDGNLKVQSTDSLLITNYSGGFHTTFPVCVDHDTDGYTDAVENYIGTDPYKSCGTNAWPADFNNDKKVNVLDITGFSAPTPAKLNTSPGITGYNKRWDLVPGRGLFTQDINIQDLTSVSTITPPMLGGVRAMNGPACTITDPPQTVFVVSPNSIETGNQVKISWSAPRAVAPCDAASSPLLGSWRGQKKTSGDESITISTAGTYQLSLTCYGAGGKTVAPTKTVTAITPCSGTPVLEVRPLEVEKGQNIALFASGMSNCTAKDIIKFESTKGTQVWDKPLVNCNLANGSNCSAIFTADWNPGGPYSIRALIDKNGDGSTEGMSNVVNIQVKAPPPPCNGTPTVSLSAAIVNPDSTVTATGAGVSSCSSLDTMHFLISSNASDWVGLAPYCNLANGSSCSNTSGVIYGLPNYVGGHVYKVKATLQKSNGQRIESATVDLIVKIPNTWGGSKYPIDPNLPTGEVALADYNERMSEQEDYEYGNGSFVGPLPTLDFMFSLAPFFMATNSFMPRDKGDFRMLDKLKECGYNVELSTPREDQHEGFDIFLNEGGNRIRIDLKVVQNSLGALESYQMPVLAGRQEFNRQWGIENGLSETSSNTLAEKLERTFRTKNRANYDIPMALVLLWDGFTDKSDPMVGPNGVIPGKFHTQINNAKMNCQRVHALVAEMKRVYKPELDSGKAYKSLQTTILEETALQRWGGQGYVPIPALPIKQITTMQQITAGYINHLKLAELDKGGGLFPSLDLNISRPSLPDVAKATAGVVTGGASTWVIVNGARAANGVGYAAGFAVGMTVDSYRSLYCGYSNDPNVECQQ